MTSFETGDLVHVPASVPLLQFDANREDRIPLSNFTTSEPTLGVVIRNLNDGYQEIYCHGEKWAVSEQSLYKIKEYPND